MAIFACCAPGLFWIQGSFRPSRALHLLCPVEEQLGQAVLALSGGWSLGKQVECGLETCQRCKADLFASVSMMLLSLSPHVSPLLSVPFPIGRRLRALRQMRLALACAVARKVPRLVMPNVAHGRLGSMKCMALPHWPVHEASTGRQRKDIGTLPNTSLQKRGLERRLAGSRCQSKA